MRNGVAFCRIGLVFNHFCVHTSRSQHVAFIFCCPTSLLPWDVRTLNFIAFLKHSMEQHKQYALYPYIRTTHTETNTHTHTSLLHTLRLPQACSRFWKYTINKGVTWAVKFQKTTPHLQLVCAHQGEDEMFEWPAVLRVAVDLCLPLEVFRKRQMLPHRVNEMIP